MVKLLAGETAEACRWVEERAPDGDDIVHLCCHAADPASCFSEPGTEDLHVSEFKVYHICEAPAYSGTAVAPAAAAAATAGGAVRRREELHREGG